MASIIVPFGKKTKKKNEALTKFINAKLGRGDFKSIEFLPDEDFFLVKFIIDDAVPGWATTTVSVLFLGGIQLLSLGVIGEYIGKMYLEVKGRPRFIIEKRTEDKE